MHRHVFVGGNFVLEGMLQNHRDELATAATPEEMDAAMKRIMEFLKTQAAKVTIGTIEQTANGVAVEVHVENLGGHKLPTAYPSRRAWLHVVVRDGSGRVVFESGALNPDGSIVGNDNDENPLKYEPHYRKITNSQQVEIYEPILKDSDGKMTTGLLHAVGYLKNNRLLPHGFDKATAEKDIAVTGDAADDPGFTDKGSTVRMWFRLKVRRGHSGWRRSFGISRSGFAGRIIWHLTKRTRHSVWCGITKQRRADHLSS